MATTTIYSSAGDGLVRNSGTGSWSTIQSASTGTLADATTSPQVGAQAAASNVYGDSKNYVDRAFFAFDTSSLPDDATIFSASLNFYVETKATGSGGSLGVTSGSQASTSTLATSDFGSVGSTDFASSRLAFSAVTTSAYNAINLNVSGLAAISKTGYTKLVLRTSFDIDNSAPTATTRSGLDLLRYSEYAGTGSDPYLTVEYGYEKTYTADAVVIVQPSVSYTADADISSNRTTKTYTADAAIERVSIVADSFLEAGASPVDMSSHTPTGGAASGTWSSHPVSGVPSKVIGTSLRYVYQASGTSLDLNSTTPPSADYEVETTVTVMATAHSCGLLARWDTTATTGYTAFIDGGGITAAGYLRLYKHVAGTATEIGTPYNIGTLTGPYRLRLRCHGSTISVWLDGVQRISVTDTSVTSAGKAGLRVTGTGTASSFRLSNWAAYTGYSLTSTYTADAVVQDNTHTKTYTADAVILGSATKTYTADALVGNVITADGVWQDTSTPQTVSSTSDGSDGLDYNAFLGLCEAADGKLVVAYHHADGHVGTGTNKLDVKIGTRTAGTNTYTWGSRTTLRTTTGTSGATPGNIADVGLRRLASDVLMLTWNESTTPGHANVNTIVRFQTMWSADNGVSWGTNSPSYNDGAIQTSAVPGWATTVTAGAGGGAYAVAPCKPVQRANGDLILATYGWDNRAIEDGGGSFNSHEYVKCCKSTDSGVTWSTIGTIFPDTAGVAYDETDLLILDDGVIVAVARTIRTSGTEYELWTSRSSDGGVTWSTPALISEFNGTAGGAGYGGRPSLIRTPNGGILLRYRVMYSGGSTWPGYAVSLDRGLTWTSKTDPYDGASERSGAAVSPRGMDIYGEFALINGSSAVAYLWSEEVVGSDAAPIYYRPLFVYDQTTKTYTADAIVSAGGTTKTYTADAIIYAPPYAVSYTADGIVKGLGLTKTYTADTVIVDAASQSTSLSWFFRRRRSNMATTKTYTQVQAKGTTRTATWTSPTYEARTEAGILVVLDVTAASGTGGLTLRINAHDLAGSVAVPLNSAPTAVTATGTTSYSVYPFGAISGALTQSTSGYLPRQFSITVTHGDSSSYTYSVGFSLLP